METILESKDGKSTNFLPDDFLDEVVGKLTDQENTFNVGVAKSVSLIGLNGNLIEVQALNGAGLPGFSIVGHIDGTLAEASSRIRGAYASSKLPWTRGKMVVNLVPAFIPKKGSSFDLAIFVATLSALKISNEKKMKCDQELLKKTLFFGEVGLDGYINPIRGILPMAKFALEHGFTQIVVPDQNLDEAKLVKGLKVISFKHVIELVEFLGGKVPENVKEKLALSPPKIIVHAKEDGKEIQKQPIDFQEVIGQEYAKNALMIAAVGGHNVLMIGPPGTGKSMLATRIPTIMPELNEQESLEVSSIHSINGTLPQGELITIPPFEAPHHSATAPSIIGGGSSIAKPGAVSRAHKGILFLDEAPEFSPKVLQTLRQPLENGEVQIERVQASAIYPAQFQLVMAANPCPCGMFFGKGTKCTCNPTMRNRYFARLSGPLLDRIDIQIGVGNIKIDLKAQAKGLDSATMKAKVILGQEKSRERLKKTPWNKNSQVPGSYYRKLLGAHHSIITKLNQLIDKSMISLRGADRVIRLSWTLADLYGLDEPNLDLLDFALQLRLQNLQ